VGIGKFSVALVPTKRLVEVGGRERGNIVISAALGKDILGGEHSNRCSSKTPGKTSV
jgi:hypothetical protein